MIINQNNNNNNNNNKLATMENSHKDQINKEKLHGMIKYRGRGESQERKLMGARVLK